MKLQLVSCTHQTASLAIRESLAFATPEVLAKAYSAWQDRFADLELAILSTCNRVELYHATVEGALPSPQEVTQFIADFHGLDVESIAPALRVVNGEQVAAHLFEVVCSLDSMVLGEPQIVRQVRDAYQLADAAGVCGTLIHTLFQAGIRVSAHVRSSTRLAEGRVSIASVAVGDFAKSIFDNFDDKLVLVIGAGEMGEETLRYLKDEGVQQLVVANRSPERSERIASEWGGKPVPWEALDQWLGRADVIVSTTGADRPIIDLARFRKSRATHPRHTVFILDLGAPRDFDPEVGKLDDVFLYDIDSLQQTCDANRKLRQREIKQARKIIELELAEYLADSRRRTGGSIVTQLRTGWHEVSKRELDKLFHRLPDLDEPARQEVTRAFERIVNKLLHPPLEALRVESRSGAPHGLLAAMRRLFGLSDDAQ